MLRGELTAGKRFAEYYQCYRRVKSREAQMSRLRDLFWPRRDERFEADLLGGLLVLIAVMISAVVSYAVGYALAAGVMDPALVGAMVFSWMLVWLLVRMMWMVPR
jgi:hypothetical protein